MTNPGESIDYLNRLEGPIVEALAAMEADRLPHAIKVGEAFLAAKNIVVKDRIKTNAGRTITGRPGYREFPSGRRSVSEPRTITCCCRGMPMFRSALRASGTEAEGKKSGEPGLRAAALAFRLPLPTRHGRRVRRAPAVYQPRRGAV